MICDNQREQNCKKGNYLYFLPGGFVCCGVNGKDYFLTGEEARKFELAHGEAKAAKKNE